jgi:glycosyltransferase involved in cell wall biosynthesis
MSKKKAEIINLPVSPLLTNKRIIFLIDSLELGGAEKQSILLADYLRNEIGSDVHYWGFQKPGKATSLCEKYKIPWRTLNINFPQNRFEKFERVKKLISELRRFKPDIILSYTMLPNVLCGIAWRFTGAKTFIWNQRDEGRGFKHIGIRTSQQSANLTPMFISNSRIGSLYLKNTFGISDERNKIVNNGIRLNTPKMNREQWRKNANICEDTFVACMIANITKEKDHLTLLRAWRKFLDRFNVPSHPPILLLAGRFEKTIYTVKALAFDLHLENSVNFLGFVDDISGLISASDLCVFSSYLEGCSNSLLECMASGLPIVATDFPGIRDYIGPENFDFLVPIKDAEKFAELIQLMACNYELRQEKGKKNIDIIKRNFSINKMYEQSLRIITKQIA